MPFSFAGRTLRRAGVVGSGRIGPGIALFLSRELGPLGVPVFVTDVSRAALDEGRAQVARRLLKAVDRGLISSDGARSAANNIKFTLDISCLIECDLVIEAVTEDPRAKADLFHEMERLVNPQAVLASNSSHLEPERIFQKVRRPERTVVLHHFFPADTNPLVEVVPGPQTRVTDWCLRLYEKLGKVPIRAGGRYGYAVNPIFEGLFLAALLEAEKGVPTPAVDAIACRTLGMSAGPFTTVNLARATGLRRTGLMESGRKIMPWFRSTPMLDRKAASGERWETADAGDTVSYSDAMFKRISAALMGAYLGLACEAVESGQADPGDLEIAIETGLAMKPPFELMNELGPWKTRELIEAYARENPGFKIPKRFGPWSLSHIRRTDIGDVAVITLKRPTKTNALTQDTYRQLDRAFAAVRDDPQIRAAVLTGFGNRAFCCGIDPATLAGLRTPLDARRLSSEGSAALSRIAGAGKPVVCALNGPAAGAGCDLAYACSARIARKDMPAPFTHHEVLMGIIPGTGATQRLPRLIDFAIAWRVLRTGGSIYITDALRCGLILEEVEGDLVERAAELARALRPVPPPDVRPHPPPPDVDLGRLSRKVDEILRKAILQGTEMPLEKALAFETDCFAEVFATRDCRIGLDNYLRTRLREHPLFVHA